MMMGLGFFLLQAGWADDAPPQEEYGRTRLGVRFNASHNFVHGKLGDRDIFFPKNNIFFGFIGPSFHADYHILDWLSLGAQYRMLFDLHSIAFHELDGVVKFLLPNLDEKRGSDYYFAFPVGYSRMTDSSDTYAKALGFNVGALFGGNYFVNSYLGFTGEVGYIYRRLGFHAVKEKRDGRFNFHEIAANIGVTVRF